MDKIHHKKEFQKENIRLAGKYNFIIYPIDYYILRKVLSSLGYNVAAPQNQGVVEGIVNVDGTIAQRNDVLVDVSVEKQIIGLRSILNC